VNSPVQQSREARFGGGAAAAAAAAATLGLLREEEALKEDKLVVALQPEERVLPVLLVVQRLGR
jgi:hypothetical protein